MRSAPFLVSTLAVLTACRAPEIATGNAASQLHALFAKEWEHRLAEDPLTATSVGRHEWNDRLPSVDPVDLARGVDFRRDVLVELATIDPEALDATDRVSYEVFERQLRDAVDAFEHGAHQLPLTSDTGFHISFIQTMRLAPTATLTDYEAYIARLEAFPGYVDQHIANMRSGLEHGRTLPRVVLDGIEVTIASHVVDDPTASLFWEPFERFPPGVPERERERLREAGRTAIRDGAVEGYRRFLDFMLGEYVPGARQSLGASELPDGRAYYAFLIRHFTTLELSPEEIHQTGLEEVARIRAEMEGVIDEVGFAGSFADFLEFLRTDPRFYAETPDELLREAAWIAKRMDGRLPALFGRLPRLPYTVAPVPDHLAPRYTGGRYVPATPGGSHPGLYWVNTWDLASRPLYVLEALTLHEAVPGHHLQMALASELDDLPPFRRFEYISAFGEGWGLYAEWLGIEAGFYSDPYSRFGRLTYEMWRACRLVIDTGIHAFGWTRQQAVDYLASNTALSLHEVTTEIDRYISWPGQALSYKLGELRIKALRREAEAALGERFDLRTFHDAVLAHGTVPLPVLERVVRRELETWQARPPEAR